MSQKEDVSGKLIRVELLFRDRNVISERILFRRGFETASIPPV